MAKEIKIKYVQVTDIYFWFLFIYHASITSLQLSYLQLACWIIAIRKGISVHRSRHRRARTVFCVTPFLWYRRYERISMGYVSNHKPLHMYDKKTCIYIYMCVNLINPPFWSSKAAPMDRTFVFGSFARDYYCQCPESCQLFQTILLQTFLFLL